jgi:hypothetical protein
MIIQYHTISPNLINMDGSADLWMIDPSAPPGSPGPSAVVTPLLLRDVPSVRFAHGWRPGTSDGKFIGNFWDLIDHRYITMMLDMAYQIPIIYLHVKKFNTVRKSTNIHRLDRTNKENNVWPDFNLELVWFQLRLHSGLSKQQRTIHIYIYI